MRAERTERRGTALGALLVVVSMLAACGEDVSLGDGRSAADAAAEQAQDASVATPRFSEPIAIAALGADDAKDDDPSLSADLTLLFFNSEREGGLGQEDIWMATRGSPASDWQAPVAVTALNTDARETGIALAADALAIWWSSDRDGGEGGLDVYTATRDSRDADWSEPQRVDALSSADDDLISAVADGGRSVWLARRTSDDDDYDLYEARRSDVDVDWEDPGPIAELNSDDEESDAFPALAGTRLLFTRDEDLQLAERARADAAFAEPVALSDLNSDADDRDAWATDDLSYVVFSSDRDGEYRLYEAAR